MAENMAKLKNRMSMPEWQSLFRQALTTILNGRPLANLPNLPRIDGRIDLRGIDISQEALKEMQKVFVGDGIRLDSRMGPILIIKNYEFRNVDFSYASFNGTHFEGCTFKNVRLVQCQGKDLRDRACTFEDVDLSYAKWRGATVGLDGSRYERVKFIGTDLRNIHCYRGYLIDCDFSEAKLQHIDFNATHFYRCKFKGTLTQVWFRGYYDIQAHEEAYGETEINPMQDVDFSEAELWDVMFTTNCDLSRVIPPQDGKHHIFKDWGCVSKKSRNELDQGWSGVYKDQARILLGIIDMRRNNMYILNRQFLGYLAGKGIKDKTQQKIFLDNFWDLLRRNDQFCRTIDSQ